MTPQPLAVEALRTGDLVHTGTEVVRVSRPPWGVPGSSRVIGVPRITVHKCRGLVAP